MFEGSIVALVTPFSNGEIDFSALEGLIEFHINAGTDGILVCGSTGEGLLLSDVERNSIISFALKKASSRIPVLVGCSACSTTEAIGLVRMAQDLGAAGVLVCSPFYVKPSQSGILEHFRVIHDTTDIPLIVYNNPGRCAVNISVDTILELAKFDRVIALKESDTNLSRITLLKSKLPDNFKFLSGDDLSLAGFLAHGGDGAISVTANVEPRLVKTLIDSWRRGDMQMMQECNRILLPLGDVLSAESNPIPVKCALSLKNLIQNELRLPLLPALSSTEEQIRKVLTLKRT
ncbi:MAG: 4-hydroxy-tetrahydrodipicolinate synthase [Holosporales bacterium]|jgi:4-hydroxy-tetrahydrodipicolinate synthase|nr:4-hydroxy-tetrahydrodipicolinate synthase [Holosporales bacterium]